MDGKELNETCGVSSEKLPNGITDIKIRRKFKKPGKCAGSVAAPGHVFYTYAFKRNGESVSGSIQITLDMEVKIGRDAIKAYVRDKYVK